MLITAEVRKQWDNVRQQLRQAVGEDNYNAWFTSLHLEDIRQHRAYCSVPVPFTKHWIENHYSRQLLLCLKTEWAFLEQVTILHRRMGETLVLPTPPKKEPVEKETTQEADQPAPDIFKMREHIATGRIHVGIRQIISFMSHHCEIPPALICSRKKTRDVLYPRQVGMYFAKEMTRKSLNEIGHAFGGRDHTTVHHALNSIVARMRETEAFALEIIHTEELFYASLAA